MEKRYKALRTIASIYKALGIIFAVLTIIGLVISCGIIFLGSSTFNQFSSEFGAGPYDMMSGAIGGLFVALMVILYGGGMALTFFAFGEGIYLFIAIEENTRTTAALLEQQPPYQPPTAPAPPV